MCPGVWSSPHHPCAFLPFIVTSPRPGRGALGSSGHLGVGELYRGGLSGPGGGDPGRDCGGLVSTCGCLPLAFSEGSGVPDRDDESDEEDLSSAGSLPLALLDNSTGWRRRIGEP